MGEPGANKTLKPRHPHTSPQQLTPVAFNPRSWASVFSVSHGALLAQSSMSFEPWAPLRATLCRAAGCEEGALSLLPHQLSTVTHSRTQGKHSPVCRASSSPPPHLLTETRLLLFLTLQLPLAWGSPPFTPTPLPQPGGTSLSF